MHTSIIASVDFLRTIELRVGTLSVIYAEVGYLCKTEGDCPVSENSERCNDMCHYAEYRYMSIVMLGDAMLSASMQIVVMLSVINT